MLTYTDVRSGPATECATHNPAPSTVMECRSTERGTSPALVCSGVVHSLKVGINTIGRLSDNDIAIDDPQVSRRHCVIVVHSDHSCEVFDRASTNGTYLNYRPVRCLTPLHEGDEIQVADHLFRLQFAANDAKEATDIVPAARKGKVFPVMLRAA